MRTLASIASVLGLAFATPALAQEGDDWDFAHDEASELMSASVEFSSGAGVIVQCQANSLVVAISGTPLSSGAYTPAVLERPNEHPVDLTWSATADGRMATTSSRRVARLLYRGGPVVVRSAAADLVFRVVFDLPVQGSALARVLSDCLTPLVDDRDMLPSAELYLEEIPIVWRANRALPGGHDDQTVEISCVVRQARLQECRSDLEIPVNPRAGEAVAEAAEGTDLELSDPAAAEGGVIDIAITGSRFRR